MSFSVETRLTGSPAHAADRRAARTARTLRRALAEGRTAVTTITFAGPVIACGKELDHVVTRASIARRPVGPRRAFARAIGGTTRLEAPGAKRAAVSVVGVHDRRRRCAVGDAELVVDGGRAARRGGGRCHDRAGRVARRRVLERRVPADGGVGVRRLISAMAVWWRQRIAALSISPTGPPRARRRTHPERGSATTTSSHPPAAVTRSRSPPLATPRRRFRGAPPGSPPRDG